MSAGPATESAPLVGVFALQGDFARHAEAWELAGARTREVRTAEDFDGLDALSLPGGESTTMLRLLSVTGLRPRFEAAVAALPVFATCAGAILLGKGGERLPARPLGVLDADVSRNAYGRQVDSFEDALDCPVLGPDATVAGMFIRAPRFTRVGPGVEIVAARRGEPVGVRQGRLVALAFHPELTDDRRLHRWFLAAVVAPARRAASLEAAS
ncbi:MAG: pyridoxal 5'-phosphate synthase glutaminase subunit PdxT [Candidatus Eisenbacteria bacterium]